MIINDDISATCEKEFGTWTIRVNGCFVGDFWRAKKALNFFSRLVEALQTKRIIGEVGDDNVLRFAPAPPA